MTVTRRPGRKWPPSATFHLLVRVRFIDVFVFFSFAMSPPVLPRRSRVLVAGTVEEKMYEKQVGRCRLFSWL